jgi:hypothetical protein
MTRRFFLYRVQWELQKIIFCTVCAIGTPTEKGYKLILSYFCLNKYSHLLLNQNICHLFVPCRVQYKLQQKKVTYLSHIIRDYYCSAQQFEPGSCVLCSITPTTDELETTMAIPCRRSYLQGSHAMDRTKYALHDEAVTVPHSSLEFTQAQ